MSGPFDLSGKVALVTGSSRGIGRAIAEALAAAGARVIISSRKQGACDAAAAAIVARHGEGRAIAIAASISDGAALERMVAQVNERLGGIDILVCNAASNPYFGPTLDMPDELFRKTFENNVMSAQRLVKLVAPGMVSRRDGVIILLSSVVAKGGSSSLGAYAVTKAAIEQHVRNLAVELGRDGIRVNAIAPGPIRTDFARAFWEDPANELMMSEGTALGRIGEPDEIAGAAVFMAARAGRFLTGQTLVIDGGVLVKGLA